METFLKTPFPKATFSGQSQPLPHPHGLGQPSILWSHRKDHSARAAAEREPAAGDCGVGPRASLCSAGGGPDSDVGACSGRSALCRPAPPEVPGRKLRIAGAAAIPCEGTVLSAKVLLWLPVGSL